MGEGKSVRVEESISKRIPMGSNFSSLANRAIDEYLNKKVWVPNYEIEQHAGISPDLLRKRTDKIEYLRTSATALAFTFYPGSQKEINTNKNIHAYANGNQNLVHDSFIYFNVEFPTNLYYFLRSRAWSDIINFINGYLAFLYFSDKEGRRLMEEQLDKTVFKSVIKIAHSQDFKYLELLQQEMVKSESGKSTLNFNNEYLRLLSKYGVDPLMYSFLPTILEVVTLPFYFCEYVQRNSSGFDIKLKSGYMRDIYEGTDDWNQIVVKGTRKDDNLQRSESEIEPWTVWSERYCALHNLPYHQKNKKTIQ